MAWVDYDTHARTRPRDDLWGQVRRTVGGQPVPPAQIDMIVAAVLRQLALCPGDTLLDVACGNGALSSLLHPHCAASLGVDVSDYLVGVAQERFSRENHRFVVGDAVGYCRSEGAPGRFTKALCYGSLGYLGDEEVAALLRTIHRRFPRVSKVLLGNLPDPARVDAFRPAGTVLPLRESRSDLGVWRSLDEVAELAGPGWQVTGSVMPAGFYGAHYRFDAGLERLP